MRDIEPRHRQGMLSNIDDAGAKTVNAVANAVGRTVKFAIKTGLAMLAFGFIAGGAAVFYLKSDVHVASVTAASNQVPSKTTATVRKDIDMAVPNIQVASREPSAHRPVLDWLEAKLGGRIGRQDDIVCRKGSAGCPGSAGYDAGYFDSGTGGPVAR